ncbi:hypothetical protein RUE5091_02532 [Ruegeria denitrificans]|uniref:Uncharacterized protein n=1 Tax=Ruegeria denitrificans TaxID=1715692 RepID=A0A0P1IBK7_9RHOB|nr:hypothetical protein RUE5091_02532 [Ruegeria denitrificans]
MFDGFSVARKLMGKSCKVSLIVILRTSSFKTSPAETFVFRKLSKTRTGFTSLVPNHLQAAILSNVYEIRLG